MTKRKLCRGGTAIWTDSGCVWWNVPGMALGLKRPIIIQDAMLPAVARQIARALTRAAARLEGQAFRQRLRKRAQARPRGKQK